MLRFLGWLSGSVLLVYLSYKFAVWHLAWQLTIICGLFLWVLSGLALLGSKLRGLKQSAADRAAMRASAGAQFARAQYVAKFGEEAAVKMDEEDSLFWQRISAPRGASK